MFSEDQAPKHYVNGRELASSFPEDSQSISLGMGCFWGAERLFWTMDKVWLTAVGYGQGQGDNPTYEQVCSGVTGHCELVKIVYTGGAPSLQAIFAKFWQNHDPTQGNRQGNDIGSQYRSMIVATETEQRDQALASKDAFADVLQSKGITLPITTTIELEKEFCLAELYHQQYLAKNPSGYCGLKGLDLG